MNNTTEPNVVSDVSVNTQKYLLKENVDFKNLFSNMEFIVKGIYNEGDDCDPTYEIIPSNSIFVSENDLLSEDERQGMIDKYITDEYESYKNEFDNEKFYLNFKTRFRNDIDDTIEIENYLRQDNFMIVFYFNHSGLRIKSMYCFPSLNHFNGFLDHVFSNDNSSELYLTWSRRKKIPVLVSY